MDYTGYRNFPDNQPDADAQHVDMLRAELAAMQAKVQRLLAIYPNPQRNQALYIASVKRDAIKAQLDAWMAGDEMELPF